MHDFTGFYERFFFMAEDLNAYGAFFLAVTDQIEGLLVHYDISFIPVH
jgi:hypothetical protein